MSIDEDLIAIAAKIAAMPKRAPITMEQALEQVAATGSDERVRDLARRKLEELRRR